MADLQQLKQKYASVIETIKKFSEEGATVEEPTLADDKLLLKGSVPSQVIANRVWDAIKQVDPQYSDLHHEIATTGGADQEYTIKPGDNLSKISQRFYGNANKYQQIAQANSIPDPDKIKVGQTIKIPVAS